MIQVVGGVYEERCLQPAWYQLYGSGGRAAAALAALTRSQVELHTYIDDHWRRNLEARAKQSGFDVQTTAIPATIVFSYVHPLSVPIISPPLHLIRQNRTLECRGESILRFGMIEGDARVDGKRVVYDPQSATTPEFFRTNGSKAEVLAVLANAYEVRLLSGVEDVEQGARGILSRDGAQVVVVKRSSRGALVVDGTGATETPAYQTDFVFSIGSGDVFAAAFTFSWAVQQRPPVESADFASRATAHYCETQSVDLPDFKTLLAVSRPAVRSTTGRAYLAGPFFNLGERWLVEEARLHLTSFGLEVFSPVHDVGPGPASRVGPADLEGLRRCDRVLALVDNADAGTLFEVGFARALSLPVVALAETLPEEQTKMLVGSGCVVTNDFATAIYKTAWI